jgi:hypothetical protein
VVYVGTDETWRWRELRGDRFFYRFWGQALRYAGGGRVREGEVLFEAERSEYELGETVVLRVVPVGGAGPGDAVTGRWRAADGPWRALSFQAEEGGHRAMVAASVRGPHRFELTAPVAAGTSVHVGVPNAEAALPTCDLELLREVARRSGGKCLSGAAAAELASVLPAGDVPAAVEARRPLWDTAAAFAAVLVLCVCEWVVRRWQNLA